MTVDEVKEVRAQIVATTARGSHTHALASLYEDVLDEIANSSSTDARALARAAIG